MKYIAYCRKSSESEEKQVQSIESQISALQEIAQRQSFKIDKIFKEEMSAKKPGRPVFAEMINFLNKNKGSTLLVWKLDRLARNPIDNGQISWLLQNEIIKEIKTPFCSYHPSDNVLLAAVEFGMANQYIRDLSVNVKRGNKTKLEKGGLPGCAPLGYLNDKANKTVYPDPERAHYIKQAFELYAAGACSLKDVTEKLYEQGFRSRKGCKVHLNQIQRILLNPFFMGVVKRLGKLYPGTHEPIISQTLFNQVNDTLTGRPHSAKQKHVFPLRGYLLCDECGCLITAEKQKTFAYYHCTNGKGICTQKKNFVRSENLDGQIANIFGKVGVDIDFIEMMYQASLQKHGNNNQAQEQSISNIRQNLEKLAHRRSKLQDIYLDDKIAEDAYNAKNLAIDNDEVLLKDQILKLEQNSEQQGYATFERTKEAFLQAHFAKSEYENGDDDKKLEQAKILLSNANLKDKIIQSYQLKMPYQLMLAGHENDDFSKWLDVVKDVRTRIQKTDRYIYVPELNI